MALLIHADGRRTYVTPVRGTRFALKEMQDYVGGYIEFLEFHLADGPRRLLVVHEEGRLRRLPLNAGASALYHEQLFGDVLYGMPEEFVEEPHV